MTIHRTRVCLAILLATALCPAAVGTAMEDGGRRTVAAIGEATVQQKPTQMRLHIQLIAKGKTMEEALAKLKERKEAAAAQLETLKADKKSIVFGAPNVFNDQSSHRRQIQAIVVAQMKSRGKKVPQGLIAPQTVTVAATLTARWPLQTDSQEKLLLFVQGIQEKIKAADLAGAKELEKATPEEEEFEEEANQIQAPSEESQQPGQPQFAFVAVLPKGEREKALADAFAKAKQRAAELAKAAGADLGPLLTLAGGSSNQANLALVYPRQFSFDFPGGTDLMPPTSSEQSDEPPSSEEKEDETSGNDPSELKFSCRVMATFQLGK